jgi:hypothetical protein
MVIIHRFFCDSNQEYVGGYGRVFSLILGHSDLRGKFFLRKNSNPLESSVLSAAGYVVLF